MGCWQQCLPLSNTNMQLQPLSQEDKGPKTNIAIVSTIQFHKGEQPGQVSENVFLEALTIKEDPKT
jgi:hypothetical protein